MNVNEIIQKCNARYVSESIELINNLQPEERAALLAEYCRNPDMRFGDNLLSACWIVLRAGGGVVDVWKIPEFSYELSVRYDQR